MLKNIDLESSFDEEYEDDSKNQFSSNKFSLEC